MMGTKKIIFAVVMSIAVLVSEVFAEASTGRELIPDDYVFAGVDGKLVQSGPDKWLFEIDTGTSEGGVEVKAGQSLELLGSATLEKLTADAKERTDAMYRLWGKVTKFEGKNYLFAVYFVGLRKVDRPATPQTAGDETKQSVNAPNDVLKIPDEIVSLLQTSEVLPSQEAPAEMQLKQDTIFANRAGFVVEKNGRYVFEPDGLGRGIERFSLELLPCQKLDDALAQQRGEPNPVRFSVAGILTRYKEKQYMLLQKLTRMYSYGNFGR
jgi:hypothetical protein